VKRVDTSIETMKKEIAKQYLESCINAGMSIYEIMEDMTWLRSYVREFIDGKLLQS
jgi:hypothetical protein